MFFLVGAGSLLLILGLGSFIYFAMVNSEDYLLVSVFGALASLVVVFFLA